MLHRFKTRIATFALLATLITTVGLSSLLLASATQKTLTPTITITTDRTRPSIDENINITVTITVDEPSTFYATTPIITGAGNATIIYEKNQTITNPGETGKLEWTYGANKPGAIQFNFDVVVKKLSDNTTVLAQSLSSKEIGISYNSEFFLVGLAFFILYVLLSTRYDWFKPKESLYHLWGGHFGLGYSIGFFCIGWLTATVTWCAGLDPFLTIVVTSSLLITYGLVCCTIHSILQKRSKKPGYKITELTGLSVVLFGLAGFFVAWQVWFPLTLLIFMGIVAAAKEVIEMRLYD